MSLDPAELPQMLRIAKNLYTYRELMATLAWRNIAMRYKQAYLGIVWAVVKPVTLMLIFTLVRSFIGIDSGDVPYPLLTLAALLPWIFFQESASEGVSSVVGNTALIKKIYFPREIFPITTVVTKLLELGIGLCLLALMMAWYGVLPTAQALWVPVLVLYTMLAALCVSFFGAALNVYFRDVSQALPVLLSLMLYASPVMYPLHLVQQKLLVQQAAGDWSQALYTLYTMNPLAGVIASFQNVMLRGLPPDCQALLPGAVLVGLVLPLSYLYFKRAEAYFADVI